MSTPGSQVDGSSSPTTRDEDLARLHRENENLEKMVNDLKKVVDELSTRRAQGGNRDLGVDREGASTGAGAPGAAAVEYAGGRVADVTGRTPADLQPVGLRARLAGLEDPGLATHPAAGTAEWWETVEVFGSSLGSGDARATSLGIRGMRLPTSLKFDGSETKFPAWKNSFAMHARQCGLFEAFTTSNDISMADVGVDLTPKIEQGHTVGEVKRAQSAWWHLLECITSDSVKAMVHNAGSPSKAWRTLNNHYLPLSDAQINLHEHKLSRMEMRQGEDPRIFFLTAQRGSWSVAHARS